MENNEANSVADNLAGAVHSIQYKEATSSDSSNSHSSSVLTEEIQDRAQARRHRHKLFWILVGSAILLGLSLLVLVYEIFSFFNC